MSRWHIENGAWLVFRNLIVSCHIYYNISLYFLHSTDLRDILSYCQIIILKRYIFYRYYETVLHFKSVYPRHDKSMDILASIMRVILRNRFVALTSVIVNIRGSLCPRSLVEKSVMNVRPSYLNVPF